MPITSKGPGDVSGYPKGSKPNLKKMPDGNPYPYELANEADEGIEDVIKVEGFESEPDYKPKADSQQGDSGEG
jgi:hypothetical protein